jgi:hypothetical protein
MKRLILGILFISTTTFIYSQDVDTDIRIIVPDPSCLKDIHIDIAEVDQAMKEALRELKAVDMEEVVIRVPEIKVDMREFEHVIMEVERGLKEIDLEEAHREMIIVHDEMIRLHESLDEDIGFKGRRHAN